MTEFKDLKISASLIKELDKHGIVKPTLVQVKSIPLIFKGRDLLVQSETGSGKTISFAIPTIDVMKPERNVQTLVITPTRELAKQVAEEFIKFSKSKGLGVAIVYGGVSIERQFSDVKKADIVVGTPGRLLDLLRRHMLNLTYAKFLVLDEADRMLDMGFIDDINKIIKHLPQEKQVLMFSATINRRIMKLKENYLNNPGVIMLDNLIKKGILKQVYYNLKPFDKISFLVNLLKDKKGLALVFCNTKNGTRLVSDVLKHNKVDAACLNGDMSQNLRERVLGDFIKKKLRVLVATDVAARGLHVEDINYVINYDLPNDAETYTHRIGRTARQGRHGTAIILLADRDYRSMDKIMQLHRGKIERKEPGSFKRVEVPRRPPRRSYDRRPGTRGPRRGPPRRPHRR